jgi:hypothetical protein
MKNAPLSDQGRGGLMSGAIEIHRNPLVRFARIRSRAANFLAVDDGEASTSNLTRQCRNLPTGESNYRHFSPRATGSFEPPKRLYSYEIRAHTPASKLSEPLELVSGPAQMSSTERDRLFSRSLPYIPTHTGASHAFAF